ncbi:hypothetical protein BH23BAC1_BH23BAC1_07180 [soil metagenome]
MINLLRLEEIAKFAFAYIATLYLGFSWWVFFLAACARYQHGGLSDQSQSGSVDL